MPRRSGVAQIPRAEIQHLIRGLAPKQAQTGWSLTSGISRRLFTLETESGWPSLPGCLRLLESWRVVKTLSRRCFSEDLEFTEQSRAASSASASTFTVLFFRTAAEERGDSAGEDRGWLRDQQSPPSDRLFVGRPSTRPLR